jgi:hypothetical protein
MPYIKPSDRVKIDTAVTQLPLDMSIGQLNYLITQVLMWYLRPEPRYEDLNALLGVLEAVKHELYRRLAVPYEDKKKEENGDVYGS